jgi:hypothetical protein
MGTMTIRLPDDKHERLHQLAKYRRMSINKLIEALSTVAITEFDVETRFRVRAARGPVEGGLRLLAKLDREPAAGEPEVK